MSSFPTWLFGLLELGRCGMSPRTSEGITRVSRRRCAALANAHGRENPYQSGHAVLWSTTWWSLLVDAYPTIAQLAEPAESPRDMHWRRGTSIPGRAFARRNSSTNCPISHSPRPRRLIRGAVQDGGGPGRRSSPGSSRLAPRWSPGPAARRRTRTGWRWWRPAQSALPGPRPDVPAQPRRRSCSDRSTATRWRIEANR